MEHVRLETIRADEKFTEPPARFNPNSLLRKMERENLGTKATRAETIDTLYRRNYIKGSKIKPTPLAVKIIAILERFCPIVIDPALTSKLENQMDMIQSNEITRAQVVMETVEHLRPVMLDLVRNEGEIGVELAEVASSERLASVTFAIPCPTCGSELRIIKSRTSGKRFIGCTGYSNGCRFTLPLPQFGKLAISAKKCAICGFQEISLRSRFRGYRTSCPQCYSTKARERSTSNDTAKLSSKGMRLSATN